MVAAAFHFEVITPDRMVLWREVMHVVIPGSDGDIGVLPNHSPLLTRLRPGIVRIGEGEDAEIYLVTGGYAEVLPERTTVLADKATARKDLTTAEMEKIRSEAAEVMSHHTHEDPAYISAKASAEYAEIGLELLRKKS